MNALLNRIRGPNGEGANLSKPSSIRVSPLLQEIARTSQADVYQKLETSETGLSGEVAEERLRHYGPNEIASERPPSLPKRFTHICLNPLVLLLLLLAIVSFATRDTRAGTVMTMMVALGVGLRFVQEARADSAAERLKAMIRVTATVVRDGQIQELPLHQLVPGDVVNLSAGDMIPADVRLIASKDLFLNQSSLTGESLPVEKFDLPDTREGVSPLELLDICFMGTNVESGTGTVVVAATGKQTYFGSMASSIIAGQNVTSFDVGVNKFTWLMIRFIMVMVPLVFLINGFTKHNWHDAFFFAVAVAVGLTPEMLPMIVTVSLSKGAISMSKKKVIVKRLNAIQNLGAMDILCTDKTGTLTMDHVMLERHCNVVRKEDDGVLVEAYLTSHFQTSLKNVLDRAVIDHANTHSCVTELSINDYTKIDEIPFDFMRKMMSVVVDAPDDKRQLISKGAPEAIFKRCTHFELDDEILPMEPILIANLQEEYEDLSSDGFRVLAVAYKEVNKKAAYSREDECELVLRGYVAFLDPPKDTALRAIAMLQKHGVAVKVLTGDNELVSKKICGEVGLKVDRMLLGDQVEKMSDQELVEAAESTALFARLSPAHKQRIICLLRGKGHVVGFMGDGINDAPALRTADVGISVDTAVDIAKDSADIILLEKSLMVLEEGVLEGRKVFANILKYIRMGASSNFGNMFSVLGASAFLPFLPMAPLQVLTNNLLYDFSQIPIPTDDVDPEQIARPRPWSVTEIKRFILYIGPISSIFDYSTFFLMLYVFKCWDPARASLFQTGWFVESLMTQTIIIHIIRTNKIPFIQSRASTPFILSSALILMTGMWLPYSPFAAALGFVALPPLYFLFLFITLVGYMTLTHVMKTWLLKKGWI